MEKKHIIETNNNKLEQAVLNDDLNTVIELTTSTKYKDLIEVDCNNNYPLRAACLKGYLNIIDFLINFPDDEIKNKIITSENIQHAIRICMEYGEIKSLFYFKEKFSNEYKEVFNTARYDSYIQSLIFKGKVEEIKILMSEFPEGTTPDWGFHIRESIQYEKKNCFNYFFEKIKKQKISIKRQEDIIHTILYKGDFNSLEKLMNEKLLNLDRNITVENFRILVDNVFPSLEYIVDKYNYKPNKKLMEKIEECIDSKDEYPLKTKIINFVQMSEKYALKKKLDKDIKSNNITTKFKNKI